MEDAAILKFFDKEGNEVTSLYSQPIPLAHSMLRLRLVNRDENGVKVSEYDAPTNLATKQFAQFVLNNIFATAQTITDTSDAGIAETATKALSSFNIIVGTGTTAAAVTDYALQTPTSGSSGTIAATINAYSGSGTSGSFTITGTITNSSGSTISYTEAGITASDGTDTFLLTHDVFTAQNVSNSGTLAVTYTLTFS